MNTPQLFEIVKRNITGWLEQDYSFWGGFEMQYRGIEPKILIEPLMRDKINTPCKEIHVYCCNGIPKLVVKLHNEKEITLYDEKLNYIDDVLSINDVKKYENSDDLTNQTFDKISVEQSRLTTFQGREYGDTGNPTKRQNCDSNFKVKQISMKETLVLSKQLAKDFLFVRVDWIIYKNKIYFAEMTFTPHSGFLKLKNNSRLENVLQGV